MPLSWWPSPGGLLGKESACNAGDPGSIPGLGRSPEKEMVTHSSFVAWRIPWTEEPGGLQSMGSQELDMTQRLNQHSKYNVEGVKNPLGFDLCLFRVCGLTLENTRTRTYCPKLQPCPVSVNVLFTIMALTSLE